MTSNNLSGNLLARFDAIERQIRELQTTPRIGDTSLVDGSLRFEDVSGVERIRIGVTPHPVGGADDFEIQIRNSANEIVTAFGDEGAIYPGLNLGGVYNIKNSESNSETSTSYVEQFGFKIAHYVGDVLNLNFLVQTGAATTCDVRMTEFYSGKTTNVVNFPANSNTLLTCEWDLTDAGLQGSWAPPGITRSIFAIEAKRTTGTNACTIFKPTDVLLGSASVLTGNLTASALS